MALTGIGRTAIAALAIAVVALAAWLILLLLVWFEIIPADADQNICEMIEELDEPDEMAETLLFPARDSEGKCVKQPFAYSAFLSQFLLRTCTYRAPDRWTNMINNAGDVFPLRWRAVSFRVNDAEFLPGYFPEVPSLYEYANIGALTEGPNEIALEWVVFLNDLFGYTGMNEIFGFTAQVEAPGVNAPNSGQPWWASFRITTRWAIRWQLEIEVRHDSGGGNWSTSFTNTYKNDGILQDGFVGELQENYYGDCQVTELPGYRMPDAVRVAVDRQQKGVEATRQARATAEPRESTPLSRHTRMLTWADANDLLKERVNRVKQRIVHELKLPEPQALQMWLFGSQVTGRSHTGQPDIDLKVYHPSFARTAPMTEEMKRVKDGLNFKVDIFYLRKPLEMPMLRIQ